MKTVSAYVTGKRQIEYIEEELPALGEHDLLIKTDAVGLCHSDLPPYLFNERYGFSEYGYRKSVPVVSPVRIGHEPVGTVVDVGSAVTGFAPGDKVSGNYHNAFSTYCIVPDDEIVVKIPETDREYICCMAEPMGCATNILHHVMEREPKSVGVIGCGYMNMMMIALLKNAGIKTIVACDIVDDKLKIAKELGATHIINSRTEDYESTVYHLTGGAFLDCVIEMCGSLGGLLTAVRMVKFAHPYGIRSLPYQGRGHVVMTSVYSRNEPFGADLSNELVIRCPILDPSHPMSGENMLLNDEEAVADFISGVIPMERLITHRTTFDDLATGFSWLENPPTDYLKGIIVFD